MLKYGNAFPDIHLFPDLHTGSCSQLVSEKVAYCLARFLLVTSYAFYATWNIKFLALLVFVSLFNFLTGKEIGAHKSRKMLLLAISGNLLVLGFFKYYDFFRLSAETIFSALGLPFSGFFGSVVLPIGLSFYILRAISYNIDIYRGEIKPTVSLLNFSVYISFFPQLLSGPIARPKEFLVQLENGGSKTIDNLQEYFVMILGGLFKKVVIASYLSMATGNVFSVPQNHSPIAVLLAIYAYAVIIYCDFSGYSDMAIGIAGLMGFQSPPNFAAPYAALSVQDFWRRWHISLSSWLRDYVYIPLGGNRKGKARKYLNSLLTMLISGIWHGTGLNYLVWGGLHGIGLAVNQIEKDYLTVNQQNRFTRAIKKFSGWFVTFNFICFSWVFFRAENISSAFATLKQLFNFSAPVEPIEAYAIYLTVIAILGFFLAERVNSFLTTFLKKLPFLLQALVIAIALILILKLGPDIVPPFIYFNF